MSVLGVLHLVWACLEEMPSLNIFDPLFMINEIQFKIRGTVYVVHFLNFLNTKWIPFSFYFIPNLKNNTLQELENIFVHIFFKQILIL